MHVEIVLPGFAGTPPAAAERLPLPRVPALELLCGRGRRRATDAGTLEDWLGAAFGLEADTLPTGALSAHGAGLPTEGLWARADPVHLRLLREGMALMPAAAFTLEDAEADALCASLNAHFKDALTLHVIRPDTWSARIAGLGAPIGQAPRALAGADVDRNLPGGTDAARWHALMNESQMLLHDHPVNEAREARGEPAVNSLWPWGAGPLPARAAGPWQSVMADDPCVPGLARLAGLRAVAARAGAEAWRAHTPDTGRQLVVLEALRTPRALGDSAALGEALAALEAAWFAPLLAALRADQIGMLTLHLPEAGLAFETTRGDLRRFWRRARALDALAGAGT
ncbi:MAG: hypothetical protein O2975_05020 [Proteobacteria bacterium]|nr:hypothetical protein [Pseudomonadota bacterium]